MIRTLASSTSFPLLAAIFATGCTGLSLGENDPASNLGTSLGAGQVGVDPMTETAYVVLDDARVDPNDDTIARALFAVKAGAKTAQKVLDLTDRHDPRLLFVSSGVMSMSQKDASEELVLLDRDTFAVKNSVDLPTWYWGTRISASRRWVAVADNEDIHHDIHLIDSTSLGVHVLPHGGDGLEAMFTNVTDRLVAVSFDSTTHDARLVSWDVAVLEATGFSPSGDGKWAGNDLDVHVPGVGPDGAFSFTWVAISPDDHLAVIPVVKFDPAADPNEATPGDDYELIVLDLVTHETKIVPRAKGPVGFTPDGSTIVSYDDDPTGGERLKLINAITLEADEEEVDIAGGLSFFVSHQNDVVVVASSWGDESLVLYDVDAHLETKMSGPGVGLTEFVTRQSPEQLWMVESGTHSKTRKPFGDLYVANLKDATVAHVATPFEPEHIGILPKRDELVVTDVEKRTLHFLDPTKRIVVRDVPISF